MKLPDTAALQTVTKTFHRNTHHRNVLGCLTAVCPQAHLAGKSWGLWVGVTEDIKQLWSEIEPIQL